jgi:hypothetical protein
VASVHIKEDGGHNAGRGWVDFKVRLEDLVDPPKLGGLVDESPANFYLFFYSGGILKIRRAKKKRKNKRTTD